ncbi:hypothetical protein BCR39DRAFT_499331 [Naematelia encephala]|uniref:Bromodomain associated domain-containing protein n=1 Tax=Naematelia encephala TaxID=71784 RepID=A0A1Y2ASU9_9TREE|nr:hypothetical protein BCR39DRAFT_499331 [Naematelia encephala]
MASPDAILHLAALHTLAQAGFASTSRAASLTLSDALARYLRIVAQACADRAALAGRTKVAAVDVVAALEELGVSGVSELHEWTAGLDKEVVFEGGVDGLGDYLGEGLSGIEGIAELRLVHDDDIPQEEDEEEDEMDVDEENVVQIKVEMDDEPVEANQAVEVEPLSLKENDYAWLPPLPTGTPQQSLQPLPLPDPDEARVISTTQSLADRYKTLIPFTSSQLSTTHPDLSVPPPFTAPRPPYPSSFPSLLSTYTATASEPSVTMRPNLYRQQALELLRRRIAPVDAYTPADTLVLPIPGPRVSPVVPSWTESQNTPIRLVPLNPSPNSTLLSALIHQMSSPNLPAPLRERLTSLRPPVPLTRDGAPVFYGESVRGPDLAALAKARGKQPLPEQEEYLRTTWDSGPHGADKWGRAKLPTGSKVRSSGIGEERPRQPGKRIPTPKQDDGRTLRIRLGSFAEGSGNGNVSPGQSIAGTTHVQAPSPGAGGVTTPGIRLRLGSKAEGSSSPGSNSTPGTLVIPSQTQGQGGATSPANTATTPGGGSGIKIKLGLRRDSAVSPGNRPGAEDVEMR